MAIHSTTCPKCGQASTEPDYCSECGTKLDASVVVTTLPSADPAMAAATNAEVCPTCQTPRPGPDARFCEVCRYDFVKGIPGGPPVQDPVQAPVVAGTKWDIVIAIDPTLDVEPDPDLQLPADPERRIPLDLPENLIGRRDDQQHIVPEIRPHDPSVSRRHAKLLVGSDGTVAILDLESANGTFVNGEQIMAGVLRELTPDDVVTLGRWTRLRITPRTSNP